MGEVIKAFVIMGCHTCVYGNFMTRIFFGMKRSKLNHCSFAFAKEIATEQERKGD